MTIIEYLEKNNITIKTISNELNIDPSTFSKIVRAKRPLGLGLYKKIKSSRLKDCSIDNLYYTDELASVLEVDSKVNKVLEEHDKHESEESIHNIDLDLRLTNKEPNKIIDIDRDLTKELKDKTETIKKLIEENKKLFRINFKYAMQLQNALDCIDDIDIQIQILRNIVDKSKNPQSHN